MNNRALAVVAALAAVLVVLAIVGQNRALAPSLSGTTLLPGLDAALNDIDEITLVGAGNETIASIRRSDDGWAVPEKDGYPADTDKIRDALLALSEARVVEEKTANPEFYDRLGVEPVAAESSAGTAVTIRHGEEAFPTVILGAVEGANQRYARLADEARSLLIDRDPELPRTAPQWLRTGILDLRSERIREVTIEHADGENLRIFKDEPGQTNYSVDAVPEGRELQYAGVANVTGNVLRELAFEDVEPAPETAEPSVTTRFETFNGLVVTARGYEQDDGNWLEFEASTDAEPAAEPAGASPAEQAAESATALADAADDGAAAEPAAASANPAAEAGAINATVAGWRYRIPAYKFEQMTRRIEDLLDDVGVSRSRRGRLAAEPRANEAEHAAAVGVEAAVPVASPQ